MPKIEIMPSVLAADMGNLEAGIRLCEQSGADQIHVDVMDGVFVPNISMGPAVVAMADQATPLPMDVHLMLLHPQDHIEAFAKAGSDTILIHIEAECDVEETLKKIRTFGCKAGITVNPPTPVDSIFPVLEKDLVDEVLVMSVNPGFAKQEFMPEALSKVKELSWTFEGDIAIDGGIKESTAPLAVEAGANILATASYFFGAEDPQEAVKQLKSLQRI